MSKKVIALIIIIILLIVIGGVIYFMNQNSTESENTNSNQENLASQTEENNQSETNTQVAEENNAENTETETNGKTLVVYYSATGNTEKVAQKIADKLGADIFELVPAQQYSSDDLDWTDDNSRVSREYQDESLRNVELQNTTIENWEQYDTVFIGYPIWWGIAAWPVDTFVKANDFAEKTVIPFCTSSSSGLGQSGELLAEEANGGNWLEGKRFRSNPSDSDINDFLESLNLN